MGTGCFEELQNIVVVDIDRDHVLLVGMADENSPHHFLPAKTVSRHGCFGSSGLTPFGIPVIS